MTKKKIIIGAAIAVAVVGYLWYMKSKKASDAATTEAEPTSEEAKAAETVIAAAQTAAPISAPTKKPLILNKFNRVSLKGGKFDKSIKAVSIPKTA